MTKDQQKKALDLIRRFVSDGEYENEDYVLHSTVPDPEFDEDADSDNGVGEALLVPEVVADAIVFLKEMGEATW